MLRGAARRTGLGLRLRPGDTVTVRNRRPGDRLKPLGSDHRRRLKDLLIDRRVPRRERDRLPLLEVGGRIVWVPGVTVHNDCRLTPSSEVWLAEIEST
jgi:tRNA(Ile)-lysidine synthase